MSDEHGLPLRYAMRFFEERGEYLIAVFDPSGKVVCAGACKDRKAAKAWGVAAVAFHEGRSERHPHDDYDTGSAAIH